MTLPAILKRLIWRLHASPRCRHCKRPLKDAKSRRAGIGPGCQKQQTVALADSGARKKYD